jgi:hypothetical protein
MLRPSRSLRRGALVLCAAALLACGGGDDATPVNDTAVAVVAPPDSMPVTPAPISTWESDLGAALVIAGAAPDEAVIVLPDTIGLRANAGSPVLDELSGRELVLYSRGRRIGVARVGAVAGAAEMGASCVQWPTTRLTLDAAAGSAPGWTIALDASRASLLPADSLEAFSAADSSRLTAEIARIASALPGDVDPDFRGLPFVVRTIHRIDLPSGSRTLVAEVVRQVNQEANPKREQLLLIAEGDSTRRSALDAAGWWHRTSGMEEALETLSFVAAISIGSSHTPAIVLARESSQGTAFTLLERTGVRQWKERWTSAIGGC